jgi:membrane-bound lytic murein transglycosylase MltF
MLAGCDRDAAQSTSASAPPIPGASPAATPVRRAPQPANEPVQLADGSFLRFRSTVDTRLDHVPLADVDTVRVLVNYNRTDFFVSQNQPRGFEYEYLREFERFLNHRLRRTGKPIRFEFVITDLDRVVTDLVEGRGDIGAANLTITPLRDQKVDFSIPYLRDVDELVIANRKAPVPASLDALGGTAVLVPRGSSYAEHLERLARAQREAGRKPVEVIQAESGLESEDILELVNAAVASYTIVDSHRARLWAQVLPKIRVLEKPVLNADGNIAWATRPGSRELRAALDAFVHQDGSRSSMNRMLFQRYFRDTRWITNPEAKPMQRRQASVIGAIKKYSQAERLDWQVVLAHAAAESGFDPSRRGPNGAVGVMQVTAAMAAAVGISDFQNPERNIEAGVRYLAKLRNEYARETGADDAATMDLALAAYRVGPEQVRALQDYARKLGLDPAKWEKNVALVSDLTLGDGPAREVDEVHLYHEAYRLLEARRQTPPVAR